MTSRASEYSRYHPNHGRPRALNAQTLPGRSRDGGPKLSSAAPNGTRPDVGPPPPLAPGRSMTGTTLRKRSETTEDTLTHSIATRARADLAGGHRSSAGGSGCHDILDRRDRNRRGRRPRRSTSSGVPMACSTSSKCSGTSATASRCTSWSSSRSRAEAPTMESFFDPVFCVRSPSWVLPPTIQALNPPPVV